jgi:hypothetical protein
MKEFVNQLLTFFNLPIQYSGFEQWIGYDGQFNLSISNFRMIHALWNIKLILIVKTTV